MLPVGCPEDDMKSAIALVAVIATSVANACQPVSPGSSVMDCRTSDQIEQARAEQAKAKADEDRAAEARAKAEQERTVRATEEKRRRTPQVAKGPATDPAELIGCRVTLTKFYELRDGMSYSQVRNILGCNGTLVSRTEIAGYASAMFSWDGEGFAASMNATFQNGDLVSRAQFGLK
jgi:hypothetical protein